ncbi:lysozyme inhibitor LprI family protein [Yoonia sp. MH D7]
MRQPNPDHIIEWRGRRGFQSGAAFDIKNRLDDLSKAWRNSPSPYMAEFVPMRISTCIEVYARELVRELTDAGSPYADQATKLVKNAKLDLAFAAHISGKSLSIGDFVAHSVSINSIDAVISIFTTLIIDFIPKLKIAHALWTEEECSWPLDPIIENYERTVSVLYQMFEVRHVLTHELPDASVVDDLDIEELCNAASLFVDACDWVVVGELHGSLPRTQTAMNIGAGECLEEAQKMLDSAFSEVAALTDIDGNRLQETQSLWQKFSDSEASLVASQVEGGSMYPMMWSSAKKDLVNDRTEQLHRIKDEWMGE